MADNTEITHGSGTSIATDEIAGVHHQRVKLQIGADGTATDVSGSEPLPVSDNGSTLSVDDGGGSLTVDGSVAVSGEPTVKVAAGTAEIGKVKVTELPSLVLAAGSAAIGKVVVSKLEEALPAGTNNIGKVTVAAIEAGSNAIGKLAANAGVNIGSVGLLPQATGGLEKTSFVSAKSTNSTLAKASTGQVFGWYIFNKEAVPVYLKLYNSASAPTVGTTAQYMVIGIPAGAAANVEFTNGIAFSTGIGLGLTKGPETGNAEEVAAGGVIVNLLWK